MINVTFYEEENYVDIETAECQWTIERPTNMILTVMVLLQLSMTRV